MLALKTLEKLPKINEVIRYHPDENDDFVLAYVLEYYDNIIYLYTQNKIIAIKIEHMIEEDPSTGDLYCKIYEDYAKELCDYCVIPEADYMLEIN